MMKGGVGRGTDLTFFRRFALQVIKGGELPDT